MADTTNFQSRLDELKESNPEIYEELIRWYGPSDLEALQKDEKVFELFVAQFNAETENRKKATEILDDAVLLPEEDENDASTPPEEETNDENNDLPEAQEETQAQTDAQTEEMVSDPFHWEDFYAPAPEAEVERFDEAYGLLESEEGKEFRERPEWKNNGLEQISEENDSLEELLDLNACRRLASSNEEISLENLSAARSEESARIKVEYYNALYAVAVGEQYNTIKPETHINRIAKLDSAVRSGKSEEEIFKLLSIAPKEADKKTALNTVVHSNTQPIAGFVEKRRKFRNTMHHFGQIMDKIQKFEQKNPLFGLGANYMLAGNPVYMGYRSILSSRALYNDFQGFKDYAAFRELYKDNVTEQGYNRFIKENEESKVTLHDYTQVKNYNNYAAYCEKHRVEANRVSEEDFNKLKQFQKKSELTREEFEQIRQFADKSYEDYKNYIDGKNKENEGKNKKEIAAVSREVFDNAVKYTAVRRTQSYGEYAKAAGERAISEAEYNRIKTLNRSLGKVSVGQALKDKTTRNAMMAHSVIFVRSLPVVGQGYALAMAAKNMVRKDYWRGLKAKAVGTGHAIKNLWNKKGRDKEAWKELYSNGGGLIAEAAGAWMLYSGASNLAQNVAAQPAETNTPTVSERPGQEAVHTAEQVAAVDSLTNDLQSSQTAVRDTTFVAGNEPFTLDSITNEDLFSAGARWQPDLNFAGQEQGHDFQTEERTGGEERTDGVADIRVAENSVVLNDEQKANLHSLFQQYPRAATIILEGNENPTVNDVTKGGFSVEGENGLYSSGVISSARLQELYDGGKLSSSQMEALVKFADAHFENGKMSEELRSELYAAAPVREASGNEQPAAAAPEREEKMPEQPVAEQSVSAEESSVRAYSFDKDGNIVYRPEALGDMANLDPDAMDARVYQDLQARQADGEKLDAGALKFMESYKAAHPDMQQQAQVVPEERKTTEPQPENQGEKLEAVNESITLARHDFKNGEGYEMSGTGIMNGKQVEIIQAYDKSGEMLVAQYSVIHDDARSTVIKTQLLDGRPYTTVADINGDNTEVREVKNASQALREALKGGTEMAGHETKGLEESQKIELADKGDNEGKEDKESKEEHSDEREEANQTDKVRSSTFRGKYWLESDANGTPQLKLRMSDPSQLQADRTLVRAFQNTVSSSSGGHYSALGGILTSDNYGAEHRDNPNTSGIRIKCEYLATTLARNEAVYQDMEHRIENGDKLSEMEIKWCQNYEKDLEKIGIIRENGRLIYEPAQTASRSFLNEPESREDQTGGSRVYSLGEEEQTSARAEREETVQVETPKEENKDEQTAENGSLEQTRLNRGGFNGTYVITETENGYNIQSNGSITVDQNILNAVRPDFRQDNEGNYTAADGSIKSSNFNIANTKAMLLAQNLTRDEAIYDHLQEEAERRELGKGERLFMEQHNENLEKAGLVRDNGGEIVKKDAYEDKPRAFLRRSRGYDD